MIQLKQSYGSSTDHPCHYLPMPLDACSLELAQDGLHACAIRSKRRQSEFSAPLHALHVCAVSRGWPWPVLPAGSPRAGRSIAADDEVRSSALVSTRTVLVDADNFL